MIFMLGWSLIVVFALLFGAAFFTTGHDYE
jgi:hypothetical protein